MKKHNVSFKYAWEGISYVFRTQPNFKIHLAFAFFAFLFGVLLRIEFIEWIILVFTVSLVLVTEMINTATESVIDLVTEKYHARAKVAKDVSAGMVLITATVAVIIGLMIFGPRLYLLVFPV
jgi:diacylglycerol kinase